MRARSCGTLRASSDTRQRSAGRWQRYRQGRRRERGPKLVANRRAQPFACVLGGQNVLAGGREAQLRDGLLDFGDLIVGDEEKSALWGNVNWISALLPR